MTQAVSHYGVHWAPGNIAFLHQIRISNAIGTNEKSPFGVQTPKRWLCNHVIALNALNPARDHIDLFRKLVSENELVRFMLPTPKPDMAPAGVVYSDNMNDDLFYIVLLLKMTSPVKPPIFWADTASVSGLLNELEMTNVQPLVLAGVTVDHLKLVGAVKQASMTAPRKLLILARKDVPLGKELTSDRFTRQDENDLAFLPWESLGAQVLKAYMRKEWSGSWFTREALPGNESKIK